MPNNNEPTLEEGQEQSSEGYVKEPPDVIQSEEYIDQVYLDGVPEKR